MNKHTISIISILVALLVVWALFFRADVVEAPTEGDMASTTPIAIDLNATSTTQNGYTVERVTETPVQVTRPSLTRSIPPQATPAQAQAVTTAVNALKKNPNSFEQWMQLGSLRFGLQDYEGARDVWEYCAQNAVPGAHENLGNLYASQLKDAVKAESHYKKALAMDVQNPSYYRALGEFYQAEGKTQEAEATLRAGIKAVPLAFDLQVVLARFLRQNGNILESNAVYDAAALAAEKAGNIALAQSIRDERAQK